MAWFLRFISGDYQGAEFPLEPGESYIIGSASEADICLQHDAMVSPTHARIICQQDHILVEDLGSTHGVYINGEKVSSASLRDNDRALMGVNIMVLRDEREVAQPPVDMQRMSTNDHHLFSGRISGYIDEVPLPDLIQLLSTSKKTGVLEIHRDARRGRIGLHYGKICFAEIDGATNLDQRKALSRLLRWQEGQFALSTIANDGISEEALINAANTNAMSALSVEALLLEAHEQGHELATLRANGPEVAFDPNATLSLPERSVGGAHALIDEAHWAIYELICKKPRAVQEILDHGTRSDLEALKTILYLLEHGWVKIKS